LGAAQFTTLQGAVELSSSDGSRSIGAVSGVATSSGDSAGFPGSLYLKRALVLENDRVFGFGLGGTLPADDVGSRGSIFPWLFCSHRLRDDIWGQGAITLNLPFSPRNDLAVFLDYGFLIPITNMSWIPDSVQVYFAPEFHANFALRDGSGGLGGFSGTTAVQNSFGSPDFILNSTIGFGVRKGPFDLQAGLAVPLLSQRFFNYESIVRIGYRF
jgi:hypothetical protein